MNNSVVNYKKNNFLTKCFAQMFLGLIITIITSLFILSNHTLLVAVVTNMRVIILVQLAIVLLIGRSLYKLSNFAVKAFFVGYSITTGVLMTSFAIIYDPFSILYVFGLTSLIFVVMAIYGMKTKEDLSSYSSFFKGGLITIIIASLINLFLNVPLFGWFISIFAIVLFTGLIAYDVNKIIKTYEENEFSEEEYSKFSTLAALTLYLDFINLFIHLLRIFGKRR